MTFQPKQSGDPAGLAVGGRNKMMLSAEAAQAAADVIMAALKQGAISAREAVDLLRVVEGLTRLTGTIAFAKKVARREVANAAQALGVDHFFAGPPAANDYARRMAEMNGPEEHAAEE